MRGWGEYRKRVVTLEGPGVEMRGRHRGDNLEGRSSRRRNRFARNDGTRQCKDEEKRDEDRKEPPDEAAGVGHGVCLSMIGIWLVSHVVGVPEFLRAIGVLRLRIRKTRECCAQDDNKFKANAALRMTIMLARISRSDENSAGANI